MRCRKNAHIGPKHNAVPNSHKTAIQNRKVEVGVEAVAERNVAPIVDGEGRLNENVVAHVPDDRLEPVKTLCCECVEGRVAGDGRKVLWKSKARRGCYDGKGRTVLYSWAQARALKRAAAREGSCAL